jgi:hypothetical protein
VVGDIYGARPGESDRLLVFLQVESPAASTPEFPARELEAELACFALFFVGADEWRGRGRSSLWDWERASSDVSP